MDGVQLPQGYSHFEEAVYFLPDILQARSMINFVVENKQNFEIKLVTFVWKFRNTSLGY